MAYVPNSNGSLLAHAIYSDGGPLLDLNSLIAPNSGWVLQSATGISDSGQIVGYGTYKGERRGFVLTPMPAPLPVPEPGSLAVFVLLAGAVGVRAARKGGATGPSLFRDGASPGRRVG
jgi:hypothetical protein